MNATKSGSGCWSSRSTRLTQLMCPNTFCCSLIYKLSPSFRSPTCKRMTKRQRPLLVIKAGWDIQGQNLPMLLTQRPCPCIWYLFTFFFLSTHPTTLHSMGNTAWDWLPARCWTSTAPAAPRGHQSAQPLSWGLCSTQQGFFPSEQLAITGKCALVQGRRFIKDPSKRFLCTTASCPFHFKASL